MEVANNCHSTAERQAAAGNTAAVAAAGHPDNNRNQSEIK